MWQMQLPWYEFIFRGAIIYIFIFILFRIMGRKHLGDLSAFDFILLLIISESLQNAMVGEDFSIPGACLVVLTLIGLDVLCNKLSFHFRSVERILEGEPKTIIKNGKVFREVLNEEKITQQELEEALREQGVLGPEEVALAVIEANGKISVVKKETNRGIQGLQH